MISLRFLLVAWLGWGVSAIVGSTSSAEDLVDRLGHPWGTATVTASRMILRQHPGVVTTWHRDSRLDRRAADGQPLFAYVQSSAGLACFISADQDGELYQAPIDGPSQPPRGMGVYFGTSLGGTAVPGGGAEIIQTPPLADGQLPPAIITLFNTHHEPLIIHLNDSQQRQEFLPVTVQPGQRVKVSIQRAADPRVRHRRVDNRVTVLPGALVDQTIVSDQTYRLRQGPRIEVRVSHMAVVSLYLDRTGKDPLAGSGRREERLIGTFDLIGDSRLRNQTVDVYRKATELVEAEIFRAAVTANSDYQWTIGASPTCDVWVDHPAVSGRHCKLIRRGGHYHVCDLGSTNGTLLGGEPLSDATSIRPDDAVTLGFNQPLPWPDPAGATSVISFGRDHHSDYSMDWPGVSGRHGRLIVGPRGTWVVEDLGSTNGIEVQPRSDASRQLITRSASVTPEATLWISGVAVSVADLLASEAAPLPDPKPQGQNHVGPPAASILQYRPWMTAAKTALRHPTVLRWGVPLAVCLIAALGSFAVMRIGNSGPTRSSIATAPATDIPDLVDSASPQPDTINPSPVEVVETTKRLPQPAAPSPTPPSNLPTSESVRQDVDVTDTADDPIAKARRALVWITVSKPDEPYRFLIGSGWSTSGDTVLTTGSLMLQVQQLREGGHTDVAVHWIDGRSDHDVVNITLHPNIRSASQQVLDADRAYREAFDDQSLPKNPEEVDTFLERRGQYLRQLGAAQASATERLIAHDVARLTIRPPIDSAVGLTMRDPKTTPRPNQRLRMVAYPIDPSDPVLDPSMFVESVVVDWRVARVVQPPDRAAAMLLRSASPSPAGRLEGSPLIDGAGHVAGVYSCPRPGEVQQLGSPVPAAWNELPRPNVSTP